MSVMGDLDFILDIVLLDLDLALLVGALALDGSGRRGGLVIVVVGRATATLRGDLAVIQLEAGRLDDSTDAASPATG